MSLIIFKKMEIKLNTSLSIFGYHFIAKTDGTGLQRQTRWTKIKKLENFGKIMISTWFYKEIYQASQIRSILQKKDRFSNMSNLNIIYLNNERRDTGK